MKINSCCDSTFAASEFPEDMYPLTSSTNLLTTTAH